MTNAIFKCPKCGKIEKQTFKVGTQPQPPICNNCNIEMKRSFGKVQVGEIVSDDMIYLGQKMLYS